MWDLSLKLLFSLFTPFLLCSLLNLYDLRFKSEEVTPKVSAYFTIATLILLSTALALIFFKIKKVSKNLSKETL
jgi:hypothetical protein